MNHLMTLCFCPSQPFFIYLPLSLYLTYHPPFLSLSAFSPFWVLNRSFPLLFFLFTEHQPLPKQQVQTASSSTLRSPVLPYPDSHILSLERACQYLPAACSCLLTVLLEHAVTFDSENPPVRDQPRAYAVAFHMRKNTQMKVCHMLLQLRHANTCGCVLRFHVAQNH